MGQKENILQFLFDGNSLTGLEALRKFGTMKLSTRVSELRALGFDIQHQMVQRNNKWVAKYFMAPCDIHEKYRIMLEQSLMKHQHPGERYGV